MCTGPESDHPTTFERRRRIWQSPQIVLLILIRCRVAFATLALPSVVIELPVVELLIPKFTVESTQPAAGVGVTVGVAVRVTVGVAVIVRVGVAVVVEVGVAV